MPEVIEKQGPGLFQAQYLLLKFEILSSKVFKFGSGPQIHGHMIWTRLLFEQRED